MLVCIISYVFKKNERRGLVIWREVLGYSPISEIQKKNKGGEFENCSSPPLLPSLSREQDGASFIVAAVSPKGAPFLSCSARSFFSFIMRMLLFDPLSLKLFSEYFPFPTLLQAQDSIPSAYQRPIITSLLL